jgi:hypothetical protein
MLKNGQSSKVDGVLGKKRSADQMDKDLYEERLMVENSKKRFRYGEEFQDESTLFDLHD